ncbi:MAG TPA: type II toxin-antitoxin system VapC family toxin [Vicinamibacterales bacterium]|nr:type II toxin-antitoxin system VapC family toxin [Vicinamibacterales bacterium]
MSLYAESSAVLAWLLDESASFSVRQLLASADMVTASDLTLVECDRVLLRAAALGELTEADAADRRAHLAAAASHWHVLRIGPEVVERARQPFPGEPVRTLDAIHLASTLVARSAVAGLELLSLDERIRRAASSLGVRVQPTLIPPMQR